MQKQFEIFCENIKLTRNQREDARIKYKRVCKKLHTHYYKTEDTRSTRFLFGSYKKNTAVRPFTEDQDVDVIFKMPIERYSEYADNTSNPQSQLLQDIRNILSDEYSTSEKVKAWGKVVLIKTTDGTHNIEILPAWEQEDGTFTIPNSNDSGHWEIFDPRQELGLFFESDKQTSGMTKELSRMIKSWAKTVSSFSMKSFELESHVMNFLCSYDLSLDSYSSIVRDFFIYLEQNTYDSNSSYITTAKDRSIKAVKYETEEKFEDATEEWKKVFGNNFPSRLSKYYFPEEISATEQYIENEVKEIKIDPSYEFQIECKVTQDGWPPMLLKAIPFLAKKKSLLFSFCRNNVPKPYSVKWKVRNTGEEARIAKGLRGEISDDKGFENKTERTLYNGTHFVECYIIKDNICVARDKIFVPIGITKENG